MKYFLFGVGISVAIGILYTYLINMIDDLMISIHRRFSYLQDRVSYNHRWMVTHTHMSNKPGNETSLGRVHRS